VTILAPKGEGARDAEQRRWSLLLLVAAWLNALRTSLDLDAEITHNGERPAQPNEARADAGRSRRVEC